MSELAGGAALLVSSVDPREREKARLLIERSQVDAESRRLKMVLADARRQAATTGRYMDARRYTALEGQLEASKKRSQELQADLTFINLQIKEQNRARGEDFRRAFYEVARERLDEATFDALREEASNRVEGEEDTP